MLSSRPTSRRALGHPGGAARAGSDASPQVSSIGGVSAFMNTGASTPPKWALESFSQSLSLEVAGFGVKVTLVQPTGYSTDRAGSSANTPPRSHLDPVRELASPSGSSPPSSGTARS